jgi:hypothetical protein
MDGLMHNFARYQRQHAAIETGRQTTYKHLESEGNDDHVMGPHLSSKEPLRGILKPARVRFEGYQEEVYQMGDLDVDPLKQMLPQMVDFLPQPPPPPPPHPPIPHVEREIPHGPPPQHGPMPPMLFNTTIDLDRYLSKNAYDLYTKFIDELAEFLYQQGEVIRKRLGVQDKRMDLKRQRVVVSQSDVMLIDRVRKYMSSENPTQDHELIALFEAAKEARNCVGPMEAEYEPLEIYLGAEESKIQRKYGELERRFENFFRLNVTSTHQSDPSDIEYEASTAASTAEDIKKEQEEADRVELLHGTRVGEEVRIGQVAVHSAGAADGSYEAGMKRTKPFLKSDMAGLLPKTLDSITGEDKEKDASLAGISGTDDTRITSAEDNEVSNRIMSMSFTGFGLVTINEPIEDSFSLLEDFETDTELLDVGNLLILEVEMEDSQSRTVSNNYLTSFDSTRDRVNQWSLHQLRISSRETYTLRRYNMNGTWDASD